jgi:DNA mismatch repair protein MutS
MQIDNTTLKDLNIFSNDDDNGSIYNLLNFAQTIDGRQFLKAILSNPLDTVDAIEDVQILLQELQAVQHDFPKKITNGSIMVMEKFYETPIEDLPQKPNQLNTLIYKIINGTDYAVTTYSVVHFVQFVNGMDYITKLLQQTKSKSLKTWIDKIDFLLKPQVVQEMIGIEDEKSLTNSKKIYYANYLKYHFKHTCIQLIEQYARLDAYLGLAIACSHYGFSFPKFSQNSTPTFKVEGLYHPLLKQPISYNLELQKNKNFLFLTGANMAGKSTFIKAAGIAVFLAHLGMGVPAKSLELSCFDGLLSNIQVGDDITKGESYFFNEVQRIKKTAEIIGNGKNWFILIDELFKGTNIQDAMKCSITVINGLHKMQNALFILSTHLYEIGNDIKHNQNIVFNYFETKIINNELQFGYILKEGISNDRLGYLILQKEGVVELLNKL